MIALLQDLPSRSAARGVLHLWGDYYLADPWFLGLAPVAVLLLVWGRGRRGRPRAHVPLLSELPRSWRQRTGWVPLLLEGLALFGVIGALARPLQSNVAHDVSSEGVDIVLAVDRSGSMRFNDLERGRSRLDVVKDVVGEFARRRMTDRVGAADSCALLTFARYPQLVCPFTLDADAFLEFLKGVELVKHREEDGTAIGVALAKAVSVLQASEAKSRVCVLLTDGENNVDDITPDEAAQLAAEEGIRVYTIYAARYLYRSDPFRGVVPTEASLDTSQLERMASLTGGRFYRATDKRRLEEIYREIEELERTPRTERRFEESFDLYPLLLLPALAAYGLAWLGAATLWRRIF